MAEKIQNLLNDKKKYYVMEQSSGTKNWWKVYGGFKKLSTAEQKLDAIMNDPDWEPPRHFAIVKAKNANYARWGLRFRETSPDQYFTKKIEIIKEVSK